MSVAFIYRQKMDFSICDHTVGFPKYSHKFLLAITWLRKKLIPNTTATHVITYTNPVVRDISRYIPVVRDISGYIPVVN